MGLTGDEWGPQRYDAAYDYNGDIDYPGPGLPYPGINGTARNLREDSEDLNGNTMFDLENSYFSIQVSLRDSAQIDVLRDYPGDQIAELIDGDLAWRKYRLPISGAVIVSDGNQEPDLGHISHIRIWVEGGSPSGNEVRLQFAEIRFVEE